MALAGMVGCGQLGMGINLGSMGDPKGAKGIDLYVAGMRAYNAGNNDVAIEKLTAAVKADPKLTMAHAKLGDMYRMRGEYDRALSEYQQAVDLDPYTAANHYKLGITYQLLQRSQDAANSYQRTLRYEPNHLGANMNIGLVYIDLGQLDDAVKYTRRATEIDPESAVAFSNLGVALDAHGQYAEAEQAYRRSLEINPKQEVTQINLATNLLAQNKTDEGMQLLRGLAEHSDTAANRKRLGDALVRTDQSDLAIVQYEKALQMDPKFYPAMNSIASMRMAEFKRSLELDNDKKNAAIEMWSRSLETHKDQPKIKQALDDARKSK
jgi:superkiller protein 3